MNQIKKAFSSLIFFLLYLTLLNGVLWANNSDFLILDVELEDYTKVKQNAAELAAIQDLKNNLTDQLIEHGISAIPVETADWTSANKSTGYIFNNPKFAVKIGEQYDTDYVVIGKISKPSNMFVLLLLQVFDVKNKVVAANFQIEMKGQWVNFVKKGLNRLSVKFSKKFLDK